ncbi:NAD-dependent epimerase/dehydratase family protein [Nibricoccus sp. IMCC34717]|uniref:NAD-dependent epimerase/dehydratase family protein n=1 Tax=Nibricoccus sp. IMCC34717 TaxID=3034021 RepID=UPI00384A8436
MAEGFRLHLVASDLSDENALEAELAVFRRKGVRILHLATINRGKCLSEEDGLKNVQMIENLCRFTDHNEAASGLFFSTTDVFGAPQALPVFENSPFSPLDHYGNSKQLGEQILNGRTQWSIFRLPGIYGPRLDDQSLVSRLRQKLVAGEVVYLSGSGKSLRDFVHLGDLLTLVSEWLNSDIRGIWNVATGVSFPMTSIVSMLSRDLQNPRVIFDPTTKIRDFDLVFDTRNLTAAFPSHNLSPIDRKLTQLIPTSARNR